MLQIFVRHQARRRGGIGGQMRRRAVDGDVHDWYLVELDEPLGYDARQNTHILIRSRWQGHSLVPNQKPSVFMVLIPDMAMLENTPLDLHKFHLIAWGKAIVL